MVLFTHSCDTATSPFTQGSNVKESFLKCFLCREETTANFRPETTCFNANQLCTQKA